MRCPCNTGLSYDECCGRYHAGAVAPTAETLMRSRFSAFVTRDADYLLRTWDPDTRPFDLTLVDLPVQFYRLDILDTVGGGPLDQEGVVEFEAFYKGGSGRLTAGAVHFPPHRTRMGLHRRRRVLTLVEAPIPIVR